MAERFHLSEEDLIEATSTTTDEPNIASNASNPDELKIPVIERFVLNGDKKTDDETPITPTVVLVVGMGKILHTLF